MISDLFIQLLEKIFGLLKRIRTPEPEGFDRAIVTIFLDMQVIHKDYIEKLSSAKVFIRAVEIDKAMEFLVIDRLELRPLRTAIQALVGQLALNKQLEKYQKLLNAMENYIDPSSTRSVMFDITNILTSLKAKKATQANQYAKQVPILINGLEFVIGELDSSWENILQEFNWVVETAEAVELTGSSTG